MLKNFAVNMLNVDTCRKGIVSTSKFVTEVFKKYQKHFENAILGKEWIMAGYYIICFICIDFQEVL